MNQRTLLVTGCSSGIGHHAAHGLGQRGWRVLATCRKREDCERLRAEGLESFPLDLASSASIEAGFAEAMERTGGRLDALFNNGAYAMPGAVEDVPVEAMRAIFETNFFGWHDLTRRALRVMRGQAHGGRVVFNSSVLGFTALRMRAPYVSTKFALEGYADVLRLELMDSPIRVILLEPGPVTSRIRQNARKHYERWIDRDSPVWGAFYRETLEPRLYDESGRKDRFELGPEATTAKLIHALESPRPRDRYYVTTPTYISAYLKRLLPGRLMDRLLMQV